MSILLGYLTGIRTQKARGSWDLKHGGENGKQQDHISRMPEQITVEQVETSILREALTGSWTLFRQTSSTSIHVDTSEM